MYITWEDRKNIGKIDDLYLVSKPALSFTYAWFLVDNTTAQFVATHDLDTYNEDMTLEQKAEVIAFYSAYVRPAQTVPTYDSNTQKIVDSAVTEKIDGLTYATYEVVALSQSEIDAKFKALVPTMLTPRQFKLQLLALGMLDDVEAVCATDRAVKIWFDESLDFQRTNEILIEKATLLGMSETDMDTFFIDGAKL